MIVFIPYINLLNLSKIQKMSIFEEYGDFNYMSHLKETQGLKAPSA